MEQLIADYIREFLFDTSELSIQNLGVFSTEFIPAEIDNSMKVIEPARKILKFREGASYTTPTFLQFMADKNNFPVSTANPYIERFVNTIKDTVEDGKQISLRGLGKFEPGLINGLRFNPDVNANFLRSTQNMNAVDLPNYNNKSADGSNDHSKDKKKTVADVIVSDLNSLKDLHNRAFNKEDSDKLGVSSKSDDIIDEVKKEAIEKPKSTEKKTVSEVLSENAKVLEPESKFDSKPTEKINYKPKTPDELIEEDEDEKSNWLWVFPVLILLLLGLMLGQIAISDRPINEIAPFSWFMSDSAGDRSLAGKTKQTGSAAIVSETEDTSNTSEEGSQQEALDEETIKTDQEETDGSANSSSSSETETENTSTSNSGSNNNSNTSNSSDNTNSNRGNTSTSNNSATASSSAGSVNDVLSTNLSNGFYIVTGTFGDSGNAMKMFNKIKQSGFTPTITKTDRGLYQCLIYAPNGQLEARQLLESVKSKVESGAFIKHVR